MFVIYGQGMWLPNLLEKLNEAEMQSLGFKLTADDIYNVNKASMKDAVVIYGRGCTGGIVSNSGLILTNHHCAYGQIQRLSSLENDYLKSGFWAQSLKEELPAPGLTASILVYMQDVTEYILTDIPEKMLESDIEKNIEDLIEKTNKDNKYTIRISPIFYGNQYIMQVYKVFKDVRLVGTPPSYIGKFGGSTDNWMWPRHTGDFAFFRIYADSNNQPAEFSKENIPYVPAYSFPISLAGVEEGDFTMVIGYPGRTNKYATSFEINHIVNEINPLVIDMRYKRLNIIREYMSKSDLLELQFTARYASISNGWKKRIGENRGVKRLNAIEKKQELEKEFSNWAIKHENIKPIYKNLIENFEMAYKELNSSSTAVTVYYESGNTIDLIRIAQQFNQLHTLSIEDKPDKEKIKNEKTRLKNSLKNLYKNLNLDIDKDIAKALLPYYLRVDENFKPSFLFKVNRRFENDFDKYIDWVFENTFLKNQKETFEFIDNYNYKRDFRKLERDPLYSLMISMLQSYRIASFVNNIWNDHIMSLYQTYIRGLKDMQENFRFFPNANGTLRVSYGQVSSYSPFDAVNYRFYTTIDGILEKHQQGIKDYYISEDFKNFLNKREFGRYAHSDGTMRVAFIASNHTTGGNSGSPVLNAQGQLIGVNFDRVWEATMSDLIFDKAFCRNITSDIRYILYITEKYAGSEHIIEELIIIE